MKKNKIELKFKSKPYSRYQMIRSYPRKSLIFSEFESSKGTIKLNQRRTQNKTKMEGTTNW